jgi:hypothetical protein
MRGSICWSARGGPRQTRFDHSHMKLGLRGRGRGGTLHRSPQYPASKRGEALMSGDFKNTLKQYCGSARGPASAFASCCAKQRNGFRTENWPYRPDAG